VGFFYAQGEKSMAGYKRKRKTYRLDFSDTEWNGLEVRVKGLTTGEYLQLVQLSATSEEGDSETEAMLKMFASHLISWNLEDDEGDPIGTSFEDIKENDFTMNMSIVRAWTDALASVPEKVEKKFTTGDAALVASIPMETL
jgi:hypothetical protein